MDTVGMSSFAYLSTFTSARAQSRHSLDQPPSSAPASDLLPPNTK